MRTMFNSVTRIFRRRSLFSFSTASETTTTTASSSPRKSRHELVSEAYAAFMEAHLEQQQEQRQQRQQRQQRSRQEEAMSSLSLPPPSSPLSSPSSPPSSLSSPTLTMRFSEDALSLSPFESLCLELHSVEESVGRYLSAPSSGFYRASDSIYF